MTPQRGGAAGSEDRTEGDGRLRVQSYAHELPDDHPEGRQRDEEPADAVSQYGGEGGRDPDPEQQRDQLQGALVDHPLHGPDAGPEAEDLVEGGVGEQRQARHDDGRRDRPSRP